MAAMALWLIVSPPVYQWKAPDSARFLLVPAPGGLTMAQGQKTDGNEPSYHLPVMAQEVVEVFMPLASGVVVDATFGGGGHATRLRDELDERTRIVAIDRDPQAVANAPAADPRLTVLEGNFGEIGEVLAGAGIHHPIGFLFDLGVSSHQFDQPSRGFSYRHDGPLDMRMGPDASLTADEVVNDWTAADLSRALKRYGEVQAPERIARAIVSARPIRSTGHLAEVVADATPAALRRRGHPARRVFQAIRIVVNQELAALEAGLDQALGMLAGGGRCAVISYHSLEDRIVKRRFAQESRACQCPPDLPVCGCGANPSLRVLNRSPIQPTPAEIESNPRARSARMRVAERLGNSS